jgi:hypothetical protein
MKKCEAFLVKGSLKNVIVKEFKTINKEKIKDVIKYVNETAFVMNKDVKIGIDCVKFQLINKKYTEMSSFKFKRAFMNTIDFKIFFDTPTNSFILYRRGDKYDLLTNSKKLSRINNRSIKDTNLNLQFLNSLPKAFDILFASLIMSIWIDFM